MSKETQANCLHQDLDKEIITLYCANHKKIKTYKLMLQQIKTERSLLHLYKLFKNHCLRKNSSPPKNLEKQFFLSLQLKANIKWPQGFTRASISIYEQLIHLAQNRDLALQCMKQQFAGVKSAYNLFRPTDYLIDSLSTHILMFFNTNGIIHLEFKV